MTTSLLTVAQAAAELKKPRSTVLRWVRNGRIVGEKIGEGATAAYVITREELDRFQQAS